MYYTVKGYKGLYCKKIDGKEKIEIFSSPIHIVNGTYQYLIRPDWIYYSDPDEGKVYRIRPDGSEKTIITDTKERYYIREYQEDGLLIAETGGKRQYKFDYKTFRITLVKEDIAEINRGFYSVYVLNEEGYLAPLPSWRVNEAGDPDLDTYLFMDANGNIKCKKDGMEWSGTYTYVDNNIIDNMILITVNAPDSFPYVGTMISFAIDGVGTRKTCPLVTNE